LISKFFSSPGGTSERIFLYFAKVSESERPAKGGGLADEDIRVVQIGVNDLFDRLARDLIDDPKLAMLQSHIAELESC
jgi:ADP-ribose diphosphatase